MVRGRYSYSGDITCIPCTPSWWLLLWRVPYECVLSLGLVHVWSVHLAILSKPVYMIISPSHVMVSIRRPMFVRNYFLIDYMGLFGSFIEISPIHASDCDLCPDPVWQITTIHASPRFLQALNYVLAVNTTRHSGRHGVTGFSIWGLTRVLQTWGDHEIYTSKFRNVLDHVWPWLISQLLSNTKALHFALTQFTRTSLNMSIVWIRALYHHFYHI